MTMDDLRNKLAEDDGSLPERWNAEDEAGTTLIGTFLRYDLIVTKLGEGKLAVIEDADDGTVYGVLLGRTVLKKRFETLDPHPGDTVGLKYVGYVEPRNKDAQGYHNYVMRVMRDTSAPALQVVPAKPPEPEDDDLPF